ncbi:Glu/Leu/Phe/Val family dehydrogenase [Arenibaculum pallidiluteum]|uniref:Glu/Leu/Phe/Val family dehydrogenase n=1 Tax=Arenibaculum pallidiluteum TaxID=2812559 RepID=UPI001A958EBE|nr:Glu/Leu/Phe/Val dehydrogenase [Arenibaculum pallidiluteum]
MVFEKLDFDGHEQVAFVTDRQTGLRAVIAIHDTARGPALGGCRMWRYGSEDEAVRDVLRLSRGMSYKNALADLPFGGGKSVILGCPRTGKTPALMAAMGRAVERLCGRYVIAEDVGTTVEDMAEIRGQTAHVAGLAEGSGDPSPATAWGVFQGLRAAVDHKLRRNSLDGLRVAVQGLGHVGRQLCGHLARNGARLTVTDIDDERTREAAESLGATVVAPEAIYDVEADVFAPCALGAVINDGTVPRLKVAVVAGAANNQLAEPRHGALLAERGILYAPDYVINAGGVINISHERGGYDRERAFAHVARIGDTLRLVFERAAQDGVAPHVAADHLARERLHRAA